MILRITPLNASKADKEKAMLDLIKEGYFIFGKYLTNKAISKTLTFIIK